MRRTLILFLSLVVSCLAARDAALAYWRNQALLAYNDGHAPQGMPVYFARDPAIAVTAALAQFATGEAGSFPAEDISTSAREALRREPLSPAALFELGMLSERRQAGAGLPYFELVQRISHRELPNELVLERLAVRHGDLAGAIRHLDRVISVSPGLVETIFPPMVPVLNNDPVRQIFMSYAARPWYSGLISIAIDKAVAPAAVAELIRAGAGHQPEAALDDLRRRLITRATAAGDYSAAQGLLAQLPAARRAGLTQLGFFTASSDPRLAPLSWALANDTSVSAHVEGEGVLAVSVAAEQTGTVAQRTTLITPGTYVLTQTVVYDDASPRAGLTWDVSCAGSAPAPLWHQPIPLHAGQANYRTQLVIGASCPAQQWRLQATGDVAQTPSQAVIRDVVLVRR